MYRKSKYKKKLALCKRKFKTLHLIENIFSCRIYCVQLPLAVYHADLEAGIHGLPDQHVS